MDFNDTPEEAAFRKEVHDWLLSVAKPRAADGSTKAPTLSVVTTPDYIQESKQWQAAKADAGFAQITYPEEYGCHGGSQIEQIIFDQEQLKFEAPEQPDIFGIGLGMCIPAILAHGTDEQKERYVKPAVRGEEIWCQMFSEPSAGSDLAYARMKAEKAGNEWILNGQKVWTSGAQYSDFGMMITRTDPSLPKHAGLTMFILDMKSAGVDVRPIRQMSGLSEFNEVFLTDVRIPDSCRVGEINGGWAVALTMLMNERAFIGGYAPPDYSELIQLAKQIPASGGTALDDGAVRDRIADWYVQSKGVEYFGFRTLSAISKGKTPGPESSLGKLVAAKQEQELGEFGMNLQDIGGALVAEAGTPLDGLFQTCFLNALGKSIAGGADEILKNILAERVLDLPADARVDKGIPFSEIPR